MSTININRIIKSYFRSKNEVINALKTAYPDVPDYLFVEFGTLYENNGDLLNLVATDLFNPFSRRAAYGFASQAGYVPVEKDGATTTLTILLKSAKAKTLPVGYQVGGLSSSNVFNIYELTAVGDSGGTDTIVVNAKQKRTYESESIGVIQNNDDFYEIIIANNQFIGIIKSTAKIFIDSIEWTRMSNLDLSGPTDKHFEMFYLHNGYAVVRFGDDVTGMKPPVNGIVTATIEVTNGTLGQMSSNSINQNIGQDSDIDSISHPTTTGGNDPEAIRNIIVNAIRQTRLRGVVFTLADVEAFAESESSVSGSVARAICTPGTGNKIGVPQLQVITGDLSPLSSGDQTTLINEIKDKSPLESYIVDILSGNFYNVTVTAVTTARSGYTKSTVDKLVLFGIAMCAIPIDGLIIGQWLDNGADYIRTNYVNTTFNTLYGLSMPDQIENGVDLNEGIDFVISEWIDLLGSEIQRQEGQILELADLYTMVNELYRFGLNTVSISSPSGDVTPGATQIIYANTINIS